MPIDLTMPEIIPVDVDLNTSVALFTIWGLRILSAALILIAGWVIGNYAKKVITSIKKLDSTLKFFLGGMAKYTVLAISIITILGQFGVQTASLIAILGAAGLALGLAMQGTLSNVAAGVMLLILRPFNVGDFIEIENVGGTVKELGLFATEMATVDNIFVFVPNNQIWNSDIRNLSRNLHRRQDITIGIGYGDDIDKAFKVIQKILDADERLIRTAGKEPEVVVGMLGESSVNIIVRVWSTTTDFLHAKWDLTKAIKEALDEAGISIPFPTRTIINVSDKSKDKKAA